MEKTNYYTKVLKDIPGVFSEGDIIDGTSANEDYRFIDFCNPEYFYRFYKAKYELNDLVYVNPKAFHSKKVQFIGKDCPNLTTRQISDILTHDNKYYKVTEIRYNKALRDFQYLLEGDKNNRIKILAAESVTQSANIKWVLDSKLKIHRVLEDKISEEVKTSGRVYNYEEEAVEAKILIEQICKQTDGLFRLNTLRNIVNFLSESCDSSF